METQRRRDAEPNQSRDPGAATVSTPKQPGTPSANFDVGRSASIIPALAAAKGLPCGSQPLPALLTNLRLQGPIHRNLRCFLDSLPQQRDHRISQRLEPFASNPGEKCGLMAITDGRSPTESEHAVRHKPSQLPGFRGLTVPGSRRVPRLRHSEAMPAQ